MRHKIAISYLLIVVLSALTLQDVIVSGCHRRNALFSHIYEAVLQIVDKQKTS